MKQVVIENPVLNSPFEAPQRHFKFDDEGITNDIVEARRISSYFIPIPPAKKRGKQLQFETEWTEERIRPNEWINQVRARVDQWRQGNHVGITSTTRRLLEYWCDPERERKLFFCQIEALETAIYLTEVAGKHGDAWIENDLRKANEDANPLLFRVAFKMATGSGKTVVMAMLIAWQALNKLANPQDARFSDSFLIVTPGITIRDRLRVLLPNDPQNYYRERDILPAELMQELERAKIIITNFHAFLLRETTQAARLTKQILTHGDEAPSPFKESPDQMVRRVCRELGNKKNILAINDEAHHCYRRRVGGEDAEPLKGQERKEAEKREEEARIWISGLEAVKAKIGVKVVYDLSATPFFLRGSGYSEGTLFPWVVSDFSLIDAIESGIVKVPRVPVADDTMRGAQPTYRDLWLRIRDHLPKKGRGTQAVSGEPKLPKELEGALHSLYGNYEKYYRRWQQDAKAREDGQTPPVFIVVCNNTNVSKLVFDYIGGWEKPLEDGSTVAVPGQLAIFSNVEDGHWRSRPNTILIDSEQLESGEAMSDEFKKIAAMEIEEFKLDLRRRFPGRDAEAITDEDLLREVMNTVGKPGKLGEQVKCVVSVSMLTEGWDANTVTHILGVRAFGTQLLCEQVVGRGLRRMSYAAERQRVAVNGKEVEFQGFATEYAEVYGVPFSFIPAAGSQKNPKPGPPPKRVRALEERSACEITFPRLTAYRFDFADEKLRAEFSEDSKLVLSTKTLTTWTENAPIVGETCIHTLDDLKTRRLQEVEFKLAKLALEGKFRDDGGHTKPWLFPQVLEIARRWLAECVICQDNTFPQLLLWTEVAHDAADRIYRAIVAGARGQKTLKPVLEPYDPQGSSRYVDFDTIRPTYETRPDKCHVNRVVADTESWEQKLAQTLENMDGEVICYVKNDHVGFTIPYTLNGEQENYRPDFIVRVNDGHGPEDPLNLILEVTGDRDGKKAAKVATARDLWVPAVNNQGRFGRWAFVEISNPWNSSNEIRSLGVTQR
ncbi:MAG TPA: DEAD/DEAH box helicase family protein [Terriglobia bacterium]|nr:DEAD/DEAH box helicase family protein [Terriglobia bacterium]